MTSHAHAKWITSRHKKIAAGYIESEAEREVRQEIDLAIALAEVVYRRRTELALTQTELAKRAGTTQKQISRIEGSAGVSSTPLLLRIAGALDSNLELRTEGDDVVVELKPRPATAA